MKLGLFQAYFRPYFRPYLGLPGLGTRALGPRVSPILYEDSSVGSVAHRYSTRICPSGLEQLTDDYTRIHSAGACARVRAHVTRARVVCIARTPIQCIYLLS